MSHDGRQQHRGTAPAVTGGLHPTPPNPFTHVHTNQETLLALEKAMGDLSAIQASDDNASAAAASDKAKAGASASGSKAGGDEASTSKQYPSLLSIDQVGLQGGPRGQRAWMVWLAAQGWQAGKEADVRIAGWVTGQGGKGRSRGVANAVRGHGLAA